MFNVAIIRFYKVIFCYFPLNKTFIFKLMKISDKTCRLIGININFVMVEDVFNMNFCWLFIRLKITFVTIMGTKCT